MCEIMATFSNNQQRRITGSSEAVCVWLGFKIAAKCHLDFVDHYVVK